jgi:ADP-ribose pyrophosphatase YjhB (NUDIX family)
MEDCKLCAFRNPKPTSTAIIIRDGKLLVVKRNEEPFKGKWDFVGGYLNEGEGPERCLKREIKEELGVDCSLTYVSCFPGNASYQGKEFPVISFSYLAELKGEIRLNEENSEFSWVPINEIKEVAFDSNEKILAYVKEHFNFPIDKIKELTRQLDPNAMIDEQSVYKAALDGFVSTVYDNGNLVGMGWIFPRQTMLRRQAVVEDMIVDESQRGKGLGQKILLDLIAWAKAKGMNTIELTTNPKRIAANSLYQKVGFKLHETNHYLYFFE